MMHIKKYFRKFDHIFQQWRSEDMVIGGIAALQLHGLNVRDTQDLDIIVYQPSKEFIDFLVKENTNEFGSSPNEVDREGNQWGSWKITRDGLTVDFILEVEEQRPEDVLAFYIKGKLWSVQGINTIIEKKRGYNRKKDLDDFKDFKRDNF